MFAFSAIAKSTTKLVTRSGATAGSVLNGLAIGFGLSPLLQTTALCSGAAIGTMARVGGYNPGYFPMAEQHGCHFVCPAGNRGAE